MENQEVKTDCKQEVNCGNTTEKSYDIYAKEREVEQQRMLRVRAVEEANKTRNGSGDIHASESLVKAAKEIYEFLKGE